MKRLKRRVLAACSILVAALLATAICAFIKWDAPRAMRAESVDVMAEQADPVTRFRTERQELRNRQIAELNDIIHSDSSDGETINLAKRQMLKLMNSQEAELRLEGLLKIRGFEDALVTVSDASVNVILSANALKRQESAAILDLVLRETGVTAGNVKILTINT